MGGGIAMSFANAGIPVTHRDVNQSVTFLSGHDRTGLTPSAIDWDGLGRSAQVIVMYMAMRYLAKISEQLILNGRSPDELVAVITKASLPEQLVLETTLGNCAMDVEKNEIEPIQPPGKGEKRNNKKENEQKRELQKRELTENRTNRK